MDKVKFLFAVHNHQPLGNFTHVFEQAFSQAYWPFLQLASQYPGFKFALHFTGFLWEFMLDKHPEGLELVRQLVKSGQVELLGGGFYEPVLTQIPEKDRQAQIRLMNDFLQEQFGVRPAGLWLAERVWEPQLASFLHRAGFSYTLLDEEHFHYAGLENIYGYYLTEDEGLSLGIFPIDKKLRYLIPFRSLEEIDSYFRKIDNQGGKVAIIGDDGEKFGLWPGTNKWVYEQGWLKTFLEYLESNQVEMLSFSAFMNQTPALGRGYLPPASYEEMMEWVLPPARQAEFIRLKTSLPEDSRLFLRGGQFRDFDLKYPESHQLRCRALQVAAEIDKNQAEEASQDLYRAQCNDAYWHGVFGGLYLPHLRRAVSSQLISAELKLPFESGWEKSDFDLDGQDEYELRTPAFFVWVKPAAGGSVIEIDDRFEGVNLTDVLTRRQEFYHLYSTSGGQAGEAKSIHEVNRVLPAEAQRWLIFDSYQRHSFLDRIFPVDINREEYEKTYYQEAENFIGRQYQARLEEDSLVLEREDEVNLKGSQARIKIKKIIRPGRNSILFAWEIENRGEADLSFSFSSEWNLALFEDQYQIKPNRLEIPGWQLNLAAVASAEIWDFPVKTVSQSEKEFEIITQGISFHFLWRLKLASRQTSLLYLTLNQGLSED
ncbi:MAG: DUF1926 domain-containing protein [Candidatus Saccharicenans sp.]|nr:DUF1926 domain-containing protein [Candidatus Saccharicenans sp.]